jgi:hypothetical protein
MATTQQTPILADTIGLTILAVLTAFCSVIVHTSEFSLSAFFFIYLALAVFGLFVWHNERFPKQPAGWLMIVFISIVVGSVNFGINAMIGCSHHPEFTLFNAVSSSGDGILTLIVYPGVIFVGFAGAVRSIYINKHR